MTTHKRPTTSDVAKRAGVSQSTVSMILNNRQNVSFSEDTVKKVFDAAVSVGYIANKFNKINNSNNSSKYILLICPNLANPYYSMLVHSVEDSAKENGYNTLVAITYRDYEIEKRYLDLINSGMIAGIIYASSPNYNDILESIPKAIPVVIIGDKNEQIDMNSVELNGIKTGMVIAEHLIELKHEKVAFVSTPLTQRQLARRKRLDGIRLSYEAHGIKDNIIVLSGSDSEDLVHHNTSTEYETGYKFAKQAIESGCDVTAFIGVDDMVAVGIMDALSDLKLRVPADYSVCGCDNTLVSSLKNISLTTVEHYITLKGKDAISILLKRLHMDSDKKNHYGPMRIDKVEYEPRLIARSSTSVNKRKK